MRDPFPALLVRLVLASAEFDLSIVVFPLLEGQVAPLSVAQDLLGTVHQGAGILADTAHE